MNLAKKINWKKCNGLVPAIIQDSESGTVLMLGYLNRLALRKTIATKRVWFYSRTKKCLWMKGEESGNILNVVSVSLDCDGDTLLVLSRPEGPTCHTGTVACFNSRPEAATIIELWRVIQNRAENLQNKKSYTSSLLRKGLDAICLKVAEESAEVVRAAQKETPQRLIEESVDLLYHNLVLLAAKKVSLSGVLVEMRKRHA